MILGLGTDITKIARIKKACEQEAFLMRVFTETERKNAGWPRRKNWVESLAGDYAAKEAVAKALGTGFSGFGPGNIEVGRSASGAPFAVLSGGAAARAEQLAVGRIWLSISHERTFATAFAVVESRN